MTRKYIKIYGLLLGMLFGAGIFALPYVFSRAGLFWGFFHFLAAFFIIIYLHFWYAEISYFTKGKHRFTGYAEIFEGKKTKFLAFLSTLFSNYGSLLIYAILGGIFFSNISTYFSQSIATLLFFLLGGVLIWGSFEKVGVVNFYLTIPLFIFVVYLLIIALPKINVDNFSTGNILNGDWFLPYGVWIFALGCTNILPEVREVIGEMDIKKFKKIIFTSILLTSFFYFLFIFSVWGTSGIFTTEDSLSGMINILGKTSLIIGSVIGLLAVFTSYVAMAIDMKYVFNYDYKINSFLSWVLTAMPPVVLYLLGVQNFVKTISIIGAVGMGIFGIFVLMIRHNMEKQFLKGKRENLIYTERGFIKRNYLLEIIVLFGLLAGVIFELLKVL